MSVKGLGVVVVVLCAQPERSWTQILILSAFTIVASSEISQIALSLNWELHLSGRPHPWCQ